MKPKYINLNLAPTYVPNWGAWEVARELACNAIDADPEGMRIEAEGSDTITISTNTVPELAELLIVGHGTKRPGGPTIGQFGEGAKMAALAATRAGGTIVLRTPGSTIEFLFRKVMGTDTLHAKVTKEQNGEGFTASVVMQDVARALEGRILPACPIGPMPRSEPEGMRVYIQGVYITTMKGTAIWDWNISGEGVTLNRDRATVSEFEVGWAIGKWLRDNATVDIARQLLCHAETIEADACGDYHVDNQLKESLAQAFEDKHGDRAVVAMGGEVDQVAARKGYTPVVVDSRDLRGALLKAGVPSSATVSSTQYDLKALPIGKYRKQLAELRKLDKIIAAPKVTVRVFEVRADELKGLAALDDMVLWLSAQLFLEGNKQELVRTYLHELAHFMSGAHDASLSFENALDGIAGRLGMAVLGVSK